MRTRIGYAHLDRLLSYPDVRYLSGCALVAGGCGPAGDLHTGGAWWVLSGFARLLAVRAASLARRVDSKPALPCGPWCALCLGLFG